MAEGGGNVGGNNGGGGAGGSGGAAGAGGGANGGAAGGAAGGAGGAGAAEKPFHESWGLDDAHRDFIVGKGFKTPADLAKSAALSDKLVRDRNVIGAPDPAKISEWEGWEKLGWTKELKDYKIAAPDGLPKGLQYDQAMEAEFIKFAHDAKIPAAQTKAMRDGMLTLMAKQLEARDAEGARKSGELKTALESEWGQDFKAKSDLAGRAARALGLDLETAGELEKFTGAPRMLKLFAKIGESLSEDTLKGGGAGRASAMTPEGAAAEQRRLSADPDFMKSLSNPRHPQHADNKARWLQLITAKVEGR